MDMGLDKEGTHKKFLLVRFYTRMMTAEMKW